MGRSTTPPVLYTSSKPSRSHRRFDTIADIGGGRGHLVRAILTATPDARGVLFDLPAVIDTLDIQHERLSVQAGDFFSITSTVAVGGAA
jgi:O-methyltransferase domain